MVKKASDKTYKLPTEKQTEDALKALPTSHSANQDLEQEEHFELPPPMKPIQDSQSSMMGNGPSSTVSAVVEQDLGKRVSTKQIDCFFFFFIQMLAEVVFNNLIIFIYLLWW